MAAGAGGLDEDQLLFAKETTDLNDKMDHECFSFSSSFACSDSKMLCFGGFNGGDVTNSGQESGSICMDYSSLSSTSSNKIRTWPKSNKKRNGSGDEPGCLSGAPTGSHGSSKKAKSSKPTHFTAGHAKTDTASVLHEALGYIRFLQDQVQVLCSPYLHRHNRPMGNDGNYQEKNMDLRSRGLCLVPIELTLHVADESNGADMWSSAALVDNVSIFRL